MRLIIMGQQAFGKACLEAVISKGKDEVAAVYCAPDKENNHLIQSRNMPLNKDSL